MLYFKRAYDFITNSDYYAYVFDIERCSSITDYVHD